MIDLSLARIQSLLCRLNSPQTRFPVIHIAGTNAKGSTVCHLSSLLQNVVGLRVGTFTSPHLVEERDACQIDGIVIDLEIWREAKQMVLEAEEHGEESNKCTPFEVLTASTFTALNLLKDGRRPDILVVEVGMGGALDATNVFNDEQVLASVITAIDFDHQALLGNTLTEIARQKAGIIKRNGLCIIADQRRQFHDDDDEKVDPTRIISFQDHEISALKADQEIVESIRKVALERNARIAQAKIPWLTLGQSDPNRSDSWPAYTTADLRYSPIMYASRIRKGDFCAKTGDHLVAGPSLRLPATRACMMGAFVALQTLWSIARDETPSGFGVDGSDANEELRLRIAFGVRDNLLAKNLIEECVASCHLAGRAEWKSISRDVFCDTEMDDDDDDERFEILTLVDGAHNPAAAIALRQYIDACIDAHTLSNFTAGKTITISWILAFSRGKAIDQMATNLTTEKSTPSERLSLDDHSIRQSKVQVQHRVGVISFSTPVEGMPWVQCMAPEEAVGHFKNKDDVIEAITLKDLPSALRWASQSGNGKVDDKVPNMIVIAGSLYLVSDVHRLR
ncbi:Mur ligase [Meira miltonrushii]|uniref:Mur ligase n=1 Tax=Meira miltonrushii TaxID=1280837 RepID=A0A316V2P4_9BASI|nr:Mur ligase [Meira miltonrushii]PWN31268.1 Mur ligase [Meira miltonrushii]